MDDESSKQTPEQPMNAPDRSHLSELYPIAKTLEDRVYDQQQKAYRQSTKRPKRIVLTTILQLFGLLAGLFVAIHAGMFSFGLSVISGVSFSLLLVVVWLAGLTWVFSTIQRRFADLGYSAKPFLTAYVCLFPASAYALSLALDPAQDRLLFAGAVAGLHIVLTTILMWLVGARS